MSLTLNDIARLSKLAQLELNERQSADALDKLNSIFLLVEQMKAVDTSGVSPLQDHHARQRSGVAAD